MQHTPEEPVIGTHKGWLFQQRLRIQYSHREQNDQAAYYSSQTDFVLMFISFSLMKLRIEEGQGIFPPLSVKCCRNFIFFQL